LGAYTTNGWGLREKKERGNAFQKNSEGKDPGMREDQVRKELKKGVEKEREKIHLKTLPIGG